MYKLLKTNSRAEKLKSSILDYTLLRKHYKFTTRNRKENTLKNRYKTESQIPIN